MIEVHIGFKELRFDRKKYMKKVEDILTKLLTEAAFEFLKAALTSVSSGPTRLHPEGYNNEFPVETGMAKGAFRQLGIWLRSRGKPYLVSIDVVKTPSRVFEGESLGKKPPFLKKRSNQYGINTIWFEWHSNVPHYQFLDVSSHPKVKSAPWRSAEKGTAAADAYIEANKDRLDRPPIGFEPL